MRNYINQIMNMVIEDMDNKEELVSKYNLNSVNNIEVVSNLKQLVNNELVLVNQVNYKEGTISKEKFENNNEYYKLLLSSLTKCLRDMHC